MFKVIEEVYDLFKPVSNENGLNFSVIQEGQVPQMIQSDELRLGQILKNLISNSMKFTPSGGTVNVLIGFQDEHLNISVTDTGIGIPAEKQEDIFGAFNQADGGTSRKYGGTGLGLSITTTLVNLLGGKISLESEVDKGSKFSVVFPIGHVDVNSLKSLPEFKSFQKIEENTTSNPAPKTEEEPIKESVEPNKADESLSGKILLIDSDISNVFTLSADFPNLEIDEAGNLEELKSKNSQDYSSILINTETIQGVSLEEIKAELSTYKVNLVFVGSGEVVESLDDRDKLKSALR